jgi:hypothetical protein
MVPKSPIPKTPSEERSLRLPGRHTPATAVAKMAMYMRTPRRATGTPKIAEYSLSLTVSQPWPSLQKRELSAK